MFRRVFTRVSSHVVHHSGGYRRGFCTSKEGNKSADFAEKVKKGRKGQNEDTSTGVEYLCYAFLWNNSADFAEKVMKGWKGQNEDTRTGLEYLYYAGLEYLYYADTLKLQLILHKHEEQDVTKVGEIEGVTKV